MNIQELRNKVGLNKTFYRNGGKNTTMDHFLNLHPTNGTHWVTYINKKNHTFGYAPQYLKHSSSMKEREKVFLMNIRYSEKTVTVSPNFNFCLSK